jgi:2-polyprenyl-3-methyl-5-hydroxy-6-metoxy-1,4-benzoquinol methylase
LRIALASLSSAAHGNDSVRFALPSRGIADWNEVAEFDQFASNYKSVLDRCVALGGESSEYFTEYKAAYIDRILGAAPAKILDFGCGVGTLSAALARHRPQDAIHGYDVSAASLDQVAPTLRERGVFTDRLDELHRDYGLIVLSNVMHHIPVDARHDTIMDLAARLAVGGRLLVIEHNPLNPLTRWIVAHCEFDDDAVLLWPDEVRRYLAAAKLSQPRRDYMLFFPKALSALRGFEGSLRWCPLGAQYALSACRSG